MHSPLSWSTTPSVSSLRMAPVGQAAAQAGRMQWLQPPEKGTVRPSRPGRRTTRRKNSPGCRPFSFWHATWQAPQAMQMALL